MSNITVPIIDALLYSSIPNYTYDPSNLSASEANELVNTLGFTASSAETMMSELMSETTLKRVCCMRSEGSPSSEIPVYIPIPTGFSKSTLQLNPQMSELGFIQKLITVPASMCETDAMKRYYKKSAQCDRFYPLYCTNQKVLFAAQQNALQEQNAKSSTPVTKYNITNLDPLQFSKYSPDCACFGPTPPYITGAAAPSCYMPGCTRNSASVYQDALSREGCDITNFCMQNVTIASANASENGSISAELKNNCGAEIEELKKITPTAITPTSNGSPIGNNNNVKNTTNVTIAPVNTSNTNTAISSIFTKGESGSSDTTLIITIVVLVLLLILSVFIIKKRRF